MPKVILAEPTPNENAMKFTVEGKVLESGSATFKKAKPTDNSIAQAVFAIEGVIAVFLLNDFVTVTKAPEADWAVLEKPVRDAINGV